MRRQQILILATTMVTAALLLSIGLGHLNASDQTNASGSDATVVEAECTPPGSVQEARGRARLLQETIHATLQIVHREYFREDEHLTIPSRTMKRVFRELKRRCNVDLHWVVINAQAMDVDHKPRNDFEKKAAAAIASGKSEYEQVSDGVYRHVGAITLASECLKCHLPNRTSTEDRAAGLVITMPIKEK